MRADTGTGDAMGPTRWTRAGPVADTSLNAIRQQDCVSALRFKALWGTRLRCLQVDEKKKMVLFSTCNKMSRGGFQLELRRTMFHGKMRAEPTNVDHVTRWIDPASQLPGFDGGKLVLWLVWISVVEDNPPHQQKRFFGCP